MVVGSKKECSHFKDHSHEKAKTRSWVEDIKWKGQGSDWLRGTVAVHGRVPQRLT